MYTMQSLLALMTLFVCFADSFSWDFVVARSNRLEFYNEGSLAYTATPAANRIEWIIYDPVHERVLFADRRNRDNSVSSFDIATKNTLSIIKKKPNRYLTSVAYDPATEVLFGTFVNKIYSYSLKPGNNDDVIEDLVINLESTQLREVAVDSCGGYIYWIASNIIERVKFNGSEREVTIDRSITVKQGLTIDTQKIYWIESQEYNDGSFCIESADLNGKNRSILYCETESESSPDKLTLSKDFISWRDSVETAFFWQLPKNSPNGTDVTPNKISMTTTSNSSFYGTQDITANYKIQEQTEDVPNCQALKSLLPGYIDCLNDFADVRPFCVNGTKISEESRCECAQDDTSKHQIGERCDVSICHNYCYQGDCYVTAEGQPKCRCYAGYSGERCVVDSCHQYCLNNGVCTLNNHSKPVCQCTRQYKGERCAVLSDTMEPTPPNDCHDRLHWLPMEGDNLPPNALTCGPGWMHNNDMYIARADVSGSLCPGKYKESLGTAFFPWGNTEHTRSRDVIQILCGSHARWVTANPNNVPENAFVGGHTGGNDQVFGESLYISRTMIDGEYVCGKAYSRNNICYFPYYGREKQMSSCEILVEPYYDGI